MIAPLLALALSAAPRLSLSVDRAFLPDAPGAVVRAELEGAGTLDVRLYQLRDPERFLGAPDDLAALVAPPTSPSRAPSPPAVLAKGAVGLRRAIHTGIEPALTPAAQAAVRLLTRGTLVDAPRELPLLRNEPLVRRWTLPCGGNEAHRYCDVDLGPLPAGVYLVEGVAGGQAGYALALVSRLALAARHTPGQVLLYAADARTGEARPGVQLAVSGPGQAALRGATGPQGTLVLHPQSRSGRALAHAGNDWAVLELPAVPPRPRGAKVWLSPTRGEARPGEVVRFLGAERPPPSAAREVPVSLEDGRGTVVATGLAHQDAQGLLSGELTLPAEAAPGLGHVVADVEGRPTAGEFWIRDPPAPDLTATASLDLSGANAVAHVRVLAANAPAPATLEWRLFRTALEGSDDEPAPTELVQEGESSAGADGQAKLELPLSEGSDARYVLEVAAVDAWGHRAPCRAEGVKLRAAVHVALVPDRRVHAPMDVPKLTLRTSDSAGRPVAARVQLRSRVAKMSAGGETASAPASLREVDVPGSGVAEVELPPLQPGYVEIEAWVGTVRAAEAVLYATQKGGDIPFTPDALTLIPDRASYAPGETARVLLFAPFESGTALVTLESGDLLRAEVVPIRGSSGLWVQMLPPGNGATFTATAVLNGQSFTAARTVRIAQPEPGSLQASLEPGPRPDTLELIVHTRDAQGRPIAGVSALASWRAAAALPPLAPPLGTFLDPPPAPEGRTDVSLEFRSAGHSGPQSSRPLPLGPAAFTPQKGLGEVQARMPHATLDALERLPSTDKSGVARLVLPAGDARAVAVQVLAALPGPDPRGPPLLLQAQSEREAPGVAAVPHLPRALRAGDRALASVTLLPTGMPLQAMVGGQTISVPADAPVEATLSLDAQHPGYRVGTAGRAVLEGRVQVVSGEEWVALSAGEAPSGTARLGGENEEGTLRLRAVSGPAGLLRLIADARPNVARTAAFELLQPEGPPRPESDARLAALAIAIGADELRADPASLSAAAAAVVAIIEPAGEVGAFPGAPFDVERTSVALWLLSRAQARGAGVPSEWLERLHNRLAAEKPHGPGAPFLALALGGSAPALDPAQLERLPVNSLSVLALVAAQRKDPRALELAMRLERLAGTSGTRACWSDDGCDPRAPATVEALTSTAWAVLGLAELRPTAPRVAAGLRYLMATRDQAVWGRGGSAGLIPLALAAGRRALPDRASTVRLLAGGGNSEAKVPAGGYAVLYGSGGPAQLRVSGAPVFYELGRARAEPSAASGELRVERRFFRIKRIGERVEREPISGKVPRGAEVLVELAVSGAAPHALLSVDDRFPAGLSPIAQPGKSDPMSELVERGAAVTYAGDRVHVALLTADGPTTTIAYLARASLGGHYVAPPAQATAGELAGRSAQAELEVEVVP